MEWSCRWGVIAAGVACTLLVLALSTLPVNARTNCNSSLSAALSIKLLDEAMAKAGRFELLNERDLRGIYAAKLMAADCYAKQKYKIAFSLLANLDRLGDPEAKALMELFPASADEQRAQCVGYAGLVGKSVLSFISAYDKEDAERMQEEVDKVGAYVWILSLKPGCLAENVASQMMLELLTRLNR